MMYKLCLVTRADPRFPGRRLSIAIPVVCQSFLKDPLKIKKKLVQRGGEGGQGASRISIVFQL